MNNYNEELLSSWLRLSTTVSNERVVSDMSYNEALVCNILNNQYKESMDELMTATDLCQKTKMLKSLMNRTLNSLEGRGLIVRQRSETDRRQVYILLQKNNLSTYLNEHDGILKLVDALAGKFGAKRVKEIIKTFDEVSDVVDEVMKEKLTK